MLTKHMLATSADTDTRLWGLLPQQAVAAPQVVW
jgi:hypothetical protein